MKTNITYLPEHKQQELHTLVSLICEQDSPEMIILFGSYARGTWVEDKFDEAHFRYQSDFDILVVMETDSEHAQVKIERKLEDAIEQAQNIQTPVSLIVHDVAFINRRLKKAQYFFSDIKREGVLLYDSGRFTLNEPKAIHPKERQKLAQENFEYYFEKADEFYRGFGFFMQEGSYNTAAFNLHQTTERLYSGILLVFTHYKPATHDIGLLRKLVSTVSKPLGVALPREAPEDKQRFKLLQKAYVDARYKRNYSITRDELEILSRQVKQLRELGERICRDTIASLYIEEDN